MNTFDATIAKPQQTIGTVLKNK